MKLLEVSKIWDKANHNAFTDLIFFKDKWYCTFRESEHHMNYDGKIRVLSSDNTKEWKSVALLEVEAEDLRDPKFSITPDDKLMINAGVRLENPKNGIKLKSITYLSDNGKDWGEPIECSTGMDTWRWSTTWHNDMAYSFAYGGKDKQGCLYTSKDGISWGVLKQNIFPKAEEKGNESSIVFSDDGKAYCLLRRNGGSFSTVLGVSKAPYQNWNWKNLKIPIGGPKMIKISNKRFLAAIRVHDRPVRTALCWVYPRSTQIKEALSLPSGGDTSYAGMVYKKGIVYISYYSAHETKCSIYLAKVKL